MVKRECRRLFHRRVWIRRHTPRARLNAPSHISWRFRDCFDHRGRRDPFVLGRRRVLLRPHGIKGRERWLIELIFGVKLGGRNRLNTSSTFCERMSASGITVFVIRRVLRILFSPHPYGKNITPQLFLAAYKSLDIEKLRTG